MLMPFQRAWQQLLLGAVVLGAALALPVLEQSHQMMGHDVHGIGDLGESEGSADGVKITNRKAHATSTEINEVKKESIAVWKQGMKKNGDESTTKLNKAIGHFEAKRFAAAARQAERVEENAAIKNHVKHPQEWAHAGAEATEQGLKMANSLVGDDVKEIENDAKNAATVAKQDPASARAMKAVHSGKLRLDEEKLSSKIYKQSKEQFGKQALKAPHRLRKVAQHLQTKANSEIAAAKWATARATSAKSFHEKIKDEKQAEKSAHLAQVNEIHAREYKKDATQVSLKVHQLQKSGKLPSSPQIKKSHPIHVRADVKQMFKEADFKPNNMLQLLQTSELGIGKAAQVMASSESKKPSSTVKPTKDSSQSASKVSHGLKPLPHSSKKSVHQKRASTKVATGKLSHTSHQPIAKAKSASPPKVQSNAQAKPIVPHAAHLVNVEEKGPHPKVFSGPHAKTEQKFASSKSHIDKTVFPGQLKSMLKQARQEEIAVADQKFLPLESKLATKLLAASENAREVAKVEKAQQKTATTISAKLLAANEAADVQRAARHAEKKYHEMREAVITAESEQVLLPSSNKGAAAQAAPHAHESLSLLQVRSTEVAPKFRLPAQAVGEIHSEIMRDATKIEAAKAKVDNTVKAAMQKAENDIHTELAPLEPHKSSPTTQAGQKNSDVMKETNFLKSLHVSPPKGANALLQVTERSSYSVFNPPVPATFKLPSSAIGNVNPGINHDLQKAIAEQEKLQAQQEAAIRNIEKENHQRFAKVEPSKMHTYKITKSVEKEVTKAGLNTERTHVKEATKEQGASVVPVDKKAVSP